MQIINKGEKLFARLGGQEIQLQPLENAEFVNAEPLAGLLLNTILQDISGISPSFSAQAAIQKLHVHTNGATALTSASFELANAQALVLSDITTAMGTEFGGFLPTAGLPILLHQVRYHAAEATVEFIYNDSFSAVLNQSDRSWSFSYLPTPSHPLTLKSLTSGLALTKDSINAVFEGSVAEKLFDTVFSAVTITVNAERQQLGFKGSALVFGDSKAEFVLDWSASSGIATSIQLHTAPLSIAEVLEIIGIHLPDSQVANFNLKFSLAECTINQYERSISLEGLIHSEAQASAAGISLSFADGVDFSLHYGSPGNQGITLGQVATALLPQSWATALPPHAPEDEDHSFYHRLLNSRLDALQLGVHLPGIRFFISASGNLLGFGGSVYFTIIHVAQGPRVYFNLSAGADEKPTPLATLITDRLFIPLPETVTALIPAFDVALRQLVIDQLSEQFSVSAVISNSIKAAGTNKEFAIEGQFAIAWKNGIDLDLSLDAYEKPVTFAGLLYSLPVGYDEVSAIFPEKLLTAIAFKYLALAVQSSEKTVTIRSIVNLFKSELDSTIVISKNDGTTKFRFLVTVDQINLHELLEETGITLPEGLPNFVFQDLQLAVDTAIGKIAFKGLSGATFPLTVGGAEIKLALAIDTAYGKKEGLTGVFAGVAELGELKINASYVVSNAHVLTIGYENQTPLDQLLDRLLPSAGWGSRIPDAKISRLNGEINLNAHTISFKAEMGLSIKNFVESLLGVDYPEILPDVALREIEIDIKGGSELALRLKVTGDEHEPLSSEQSHLYISSIDFAYRYQKNAEGAGHQATLKANARMNLNGVMVIDSSQLDFKYEQLPGHQASWILNGDVKAQVFGHDLTLAAFYEKASDTQKAGFKYSGKLFEVAIAGVATYTLHDAVFELRKTEGKAVGLALSATSNLDIAEGLLKFTDITTMLFHEGKTTGIALSTKECKLELHPDYPYFVIDDAQLKLAFSGKNNWAISGHTQIRAANVPETLSYILPEKCGCEFEFSPTKAMISMSNNKIWNIPMPPHIEGVDLSAFDLGIACVGVQDLHIDFKRVEVGATVVIGLPKKLNDVFKGPDGEVNEIFRVYDPVTKEGTIGLSFALGKSTFKFTLNDSPFKNFLEIQTNGARRFIRIEMATKQDAIEIDVPEFTIGAKGEISLSGGFDIIGDVSLPLTPLNFLLNKIGLEAIAKKLGKGIPIRDLKFSKKTGDHWNFNSAAFIDYFAGNQVEVPAWLRTGFNDIDKVVSKLPDLLLEYGNFELPRHLHFSLKYTVTNSLSFKISVEDPNNAKEEVTPLKLIIPQLPVFTGIQLYSLSFGELFGGTFFNLDVNAVIDTFDLPSLVACLLLDDNQPVVKAYLPPLKSLHRRTKLKNLSVLIIYQFAIPVPVPLFYDEVSFSSLTLEGTEVESGFQFPMPEFDKESITDLVQVGRRMISFFKPDKTHHDDFGELQLRFLPKFTVMKNYIRLPKYMAREVMHDKNSIGKRIGTDGFVIDPGKLIAAVADAMQKGSINKLIQIVELEKRHGLLEISLFDTLDINFKYAFATPWEFMTTAYHALNIDEGKKDLYLNLLQEKTAPITKDTEGLVIFMNGKLKFQRFIKFDIGFAIAATEGNFAIGGKFDGKIGELNDKTYAIDIALQGLVVIQQKGGILLEGDGHIDLLGMNIVSGKFCYDNAHITIDAAVDSVNGLIAYKGSLKGKFTNDEFSLVGSSAMTLLGYPISAGDFAIQDTKNEQVFSMSGITSIPYIGSLAASIHYRAQLQEALSVAVSFKGEVLQLLTLSIAGALKAGHNTTEASGTIALYIGHNELLQGRFSSMNDCFSFEGQASLNIKVGALDYIDIVGAVHGKMSNTEFSLTGKTEVKVMGYPLTSASILLDQDQATLSASFFEVGNVLHLERTDNGQLKMYGSMDEVNIGPLFHIGAVPDSLRPALLAQFSNTSILNAKHGPVMVVADDQFFLQGEVYLLGIKTTVSNLTIGYAGITMQLEGNLFGVIRSNILAEMKVLRHDDSIFFTGEVFFGNLIADLIDEIHRTAKNIKAALDKAREDLNEANKKVKAAAEAIAADIDAKLHEFDENLRNARKFLHEREIEVDGINGNISKLREVISALKFEIEQETNAYDNLSFFYRVLHFFEYSASVASKGFQIAALYAGIGTFEAAKIIALGLLEGAKAAVYGLEELSHQAQEKVDKGLQLFKEGADRLCEAAKNSLLLISAAVGDFESWSVNVLGAIGREQDQLLVIHSAKFRKQSLHQLQQGKVNLELKMKFLGNEMEIPVHVNLAKLEIGIQDITTALKKGNKSPGLIAEEGSHQGEPLKIIAERILERYPDFDAVQMYATLIKANFAPELIQLHVLKEIYVKRGATIYDIVNALTAGAE
jgi:hypothetical protein